jgi:hypothetical protein
MKKLYIFGLTLMVMLSIMTVGVAAVEYTQSDDQAATSGQAQVQGATSSSSSMFYSCDGVPYCYYHVTSYQTGISGTGVSAYMTQNNPKLDSTGVFSASIINIANYSHLLNGLQYGWMKATWLGDKPVIFVEFWNNSKACQNYGDFKGGFSNSCGYVQVDKKYHVGMYLRNWDTKSGDLARFSIEYDDRDGGKWWILYDNIKMGYYPESLWNGTFRRGDYFAYWGEVVTGKQSLTEMGNGLPANNTRSAKIIRQQYKSLSGRWVSADTHKTATNPDHYTVYPLGKDGMRYGGPGCMCDPVAPAQVG